MHAVAGGQADGFGVTGGVAGDVHTGVADPDDQHPLPGEHGQVAVIVGVERLAGELTVEVRGLGLE